MTFALNDISGAAGKVRGCSVGKCRSGDKKPTNTKTNTNTNTKKGQSQKTYTEKIISNTKNTSNIRKSANNIRKNKNTNTKNTKTNLKQLQRQRKSASKGRSCLVQGDVSLKINSPQIRMQIQRQRH